MAVGDREFGELLGRVDALTTALHEALPALARRDMCQASCGQLERRVTALETRPARLWPAVIGALGVMLAAASLVVSMVR